MINTKRIKKEDVLSILSYLKTDKTIYEEKFDFEDLYIELQYSDDEYVDLENVIDHILYDSHYIYLKLTSFDDDAFKEKMKMFGAIDDIDYTEILKQSYKDIKKYVKVYDELIVNCDFSYDDVKKLQKKFINEKMNILILKEEYEQCKVLKERLNHINPQ